MCTPPNALSALRTDDSLTCRQYVFRLFVQSHVIPLYCLLTSETVETVSENDVHVPLAMHHRDTGCNSERERSERGDRVTA
jgi:hypothetical protein